MTQRTAWTAETAERVFRDFITTHFVSANQYDRIAAESGGALPARATLCKLTGKSWSELVTGQLSNVNSKTTTSALLIQNKQLLSKLHSQEQTLQLFLDNCTSSIQKLNIKPVSIPTKVKSNEDLEMHALRSDDHCGSKLTLAATQGLSGYDAATYKRRLHKWVEKILLFKNQDQMPLGLNKLIIYFLGDIVTGENIYRGQSFALDLFLTEQLFYALELNVNVILGLAAEFNKVEIFAVQGNHGRPSEKGSNHYLTNFDYILYRIMQLMLRPQTNVKMYVSESPEMVVRNGDFNFHLSHGEHVRSYSGTPYYGMDRKYRKLSGLYNMIIDYQLQGHFHSPAQLSEHIIVNGSMVGGDDLSINQLSVATLPSQKLFYFHQKHGINRMSDLFLDTKPSLKVDDLSGVYTPHVK